MADSAQESATERGKMCFLLVYINIVAFCEPGGVSEALIDFLLLNVLIFFNAN